MVAPSMLFCNVAAKGVICLEHFVIVRSVFVVVQKKGGLCFFVRLRIIMRPIYSLLWHVAALHSVR
jgi:hypothetical protein